jgi:hypothetical protein
MALFTVKVALLPVKVNVSQITDIVGVGVGVEVSVGVGVCEDVIDGVGVGVDVFVGVGLTQVLISDIIKSPSSVRMKLPSSSVRY